MERGAPRVRHEARINLLGFKDCGDERSRICTSGDPKMVGKCRDKNVNYRFDCLIFLEDEDPEKRKKCAYAGETSLNGFNRGGTTHNMPK